MAFIRIDLPVVLDVELTDYCYDRVLFLYQSYAFSLNQLRGKSPSPEDEVLCFMLIKCFYVSFERSELEHNNIYSPFHIVQITHFQVQITHFLEILH